MATTLHACGTAALGGGIFLAGQIFHLSEHWPSGVLLWSLGAWTGWALLRDWPHAFFAAVLTPAWLVGEWMVAATSRAGAAVLATEVLVTALAYLSAVPDPRGISSAPRTTLAWIGGIALVPAALALVAAHGDSYLPGDLDRVLSVAGWIGAIGLPVALAWWLRSGLSLPLLSLAAWTVAGPFFAGRRGAYPFLWAGVLSLGLVTWGLLERRSERINLGVAGFGITVLSFYFSSLMDRLGRSASLVGLGLLFLGGGWAMEQGRRRLVARVAGGQPVTRWQAGLLLTALHVAMLGTLGLKLVADRARLPRAWARTQPYDPSTPLRGRYVRLALEIPLTTGGSARGGVGDRGGASARWMERSWARSTTR